MSKKEYDVIIVGGSYAGLAAAMTLGRSLRKTLIIDSGNPCNRQTPYSHNFLTQDGKPPKEIASLAKEQVAQYESISFLSDTVVSGRSIEEGFEIETQNRDVLSGKRLIFASGVKDEMPNIPGFAECWGISVIHCPYCHGYEVRDQKTGIMANGEIAFHYAMLVYNLSKDIVLLTNGQAEFSEEQHAALKRNNIEIVESEVVKIEHDNGRMNHVILQNGEQIRLSAMYATVPSTQHCILPESLGCAMIESGHIEVDMGQQSSLEGVFACGDCASPMRSVTLAVSSGHVAGAMVNMSLATL
ncbi:MAG: NAD(P)/FAD-dependent oxidoreductase [Calditrichia bacterium]